MHAMAFALRLQVELSGRFSGRTLDPRGVAQNMAWKKDGTQLKLKNPSKVAATAHTACSNSTGKHCQAANML
jgi:P pilus assembly chaperone PapD